MPHDSEDPLAWVTHRFDDPIVRDGPNVERSSGLARPEAMVAVDPSALAFDADRLIGSYVSFDTLQGHAIAPLNQLHPAADADDGQLLRAGPIEQCRFGLIPLRRVAAELGQIVSPRKDQAINLGCLAQPKRHRWHIGNCERQQAASLEELRPRLIQAVASFTVRRHYGDALSDGDGVHAIADTLWFRQSIESVCAARQRS